MRDIFFLLFLLAILFMAIKRPFLFILTFCYVDIVAPQRLSFFLLNQVPLSLIVFLFAIGSWLLADRKKGVRFDWLQGVLIALLCYCPAVPVACCDIKRAVRRLHHVAYPAVACEGVAAGI